MAFHQELSETCLDLLARFVYHRIDYAFLKRTPNRLSLPGYFLVFIIDFFASKAMVYSILICTCSTQLLFETKSFSLHRWRFKCVMSFNRYMFANVSVQQRRLPTSDFLLKEGQSASWVMGAMIITITTSRYITHTMLKSGKNICAGNIFLWQVYFSLQTSKKTNV